MLIEKNEVIKQKKREIKEKTIVELRKELENMQKLNRLLVKQMKKQRKSKSKKIQNINKTIQNIK